jgi:hypothetical protein
MFQASLETHGDHVSKTRQNQNERKMMLKNGIFQALCDSTMSPLSKSIPSRRGMLCGVFLWTLLPPQALQWLHAKRIIPAQVRVCSNLSSAGPQLSCQTQRPSCWSHLTFKRGAAWGRSCVSNTCASHGPAEGHRDEHLNRDSVEGENGRSPLLPPL